MKTLEYEGKAIFSRYGLPVPRGKVVESALEAKEVAEELGGEVIVKGQVPAGGRGKEGGIKKASNPQEAFHWAKEIRGMSIKGYKVKKIYIEEKVEVKEEYYLSFILDRSSSLPLFIISSEGGVDIEKVAREEPEKVRRLSIDPLWGIHPYQVRREALKAQIPSAQLNQLSSIVLKLYQVFRGEDALLAEINPVILTVQGDLVCGDSKIELDDNASFRHQELFNSLESFQEEESLEGRAREKGLSFVKLEGNIGVIGNGAGLVMSTLDSISREGGSPANFLDIGGGAPADKMEAAINIVLDNPQVNSLLINIFGGITRCDEAARGIISAVKRIGPGIIPVVRLGGTNEAEGWSILKDSGLEIEVCKNMKEAVVKAIELGEEV